MILNDKLCICCQECMLYFSAPWHRFMCSFDGLFKFLFFWWSFGGICFQELMPFLEPIKISCKDWKYEFPNPHVGHGLVPQVAWTWTFTWLDLRGNGCQVTTHRKWRVTSVFLWHPDNTPWFVKSNPQNISEYKRMCNVHIGQKG